MIRLHDGAALATGGAHGIGRAAFPHHDVADEDSWSAAVARAGSEFSGLDVLVDNADTGGLGTKAADEHLKASGHGSVISISSSFGTSGGTGTSPAHHVSEEAVRTRTKNVALAWARARVRVNSIHPGFIDTPIGRPEEVAAAAAYLAGDDASFVTGAELHVDGGYIAR